jgi:hypothetical protein
MQEIIFLVEDSIEGGFTAKAIGHSIYTESETYESLKTILLDAVICKFWYN